MENTQAVGEDLTDLPAPASAVACPPRRGSSQQCTQPSSAATATQADSIADGEGRNQALGQGPADCGHASVSANTVSPLMSLLDWSALGLRRGQELETEHLSLLGSSDAISSSENGVSSTLISPSRRRRQGHSSTWNGHRAVELRELQPLEREEGRRANLSHDSAAGVPAVASAAATSGWGDGPGDGTKEEEYEVASGRDSMWDISSYLLSPRSEISVDDYQKGTVSSGIFNLSTTVIGAGIMGLPATFRVLGLPLGVVLLIAMAWLTECSLEILVQTCAAMQRWTYSEVVDAACGPRARFVLDVSVLLNNLGMCIIYLIIVADVVSGTETLAADGSVDHPGILFEWGLRNQWWASRTFIILGTMLFFLLPLSCLKHVDSLSYTSAIAVASAVFFVGITMVLAVAAGLQGRLQAPSMYPQALRDGSWLSLFSVLPVMATAYTCHFSIHPIYHELKDRSEERMFVITKVSMLLCTAIYLCTSLSGYLLFGPSTASDILINFDRDMGVAHGAAINTAIRCSYVLHIILVFPVIFYSLRGTMDSLLFPHAEFHVTEDGRRFFWITALGLIIVFVGAVAVPNIWTVFEITGATGTMLLSFFFPAVLALRDKLGAVSSSQIWLARFMIVFSVIVSVTGVTTSLLNFILS